MTLYEQLVRHNESDIYPFHMPGHKRNNAKAPDISPYDIDITEIDGFDDLHHAKGCIMEAQNRASRMYGTESAHFLINGCTGGLLAAITACCTSRREILISRNCHKSVYNAIMLRKLKPHYVWPYELDGIAGQVISPVDVEQILCSNKDIGCVVITSPTYEGVVSDVKAIAEVAHEYGVPLIVDEAHGAHFQWHDMFPESAVKLGADIVIHGIHKTLPSFTQTGLLHVCSDRVCRTEIERYLSVYQSSSPSYLLMGSIDYCMDYLERCGAGDYEIYAERLQKLYNRLGSLKNIYILPYSVKRDASKIVVCTDRVAIDGRECYNILREQYRLQPEMSKEEYVILMTSVWDSDSAYNRLTEALMEIDDGCEGCVPEESAGSRIGSICGSFKGNGISYPVNEVVCDIDIAVCMDGRLTELSDSEGMISGDMVYIYPPGIPYIVPGERISRDCIEQLLDFADRGYEIKGMADADGRMIRVIRDDICNNGQECNG